MQPQITNSNSKDKDLNPNPNPNSSIPRQQQHHYQLHREHHRISTTSPDPSGSAQSTPRESPAFTRLQHSPPTVLPSSRTRAASLAQDSRPQSDPSAATDFARPSVFRRRSSTARWGFIGWNNDLPPIANLHPVHSTTRPSTDEHGREAEVALALTSGITSPESTTQGVKRTHSRFDLSKVPESDISRKQRALPAATLPSATSSSTAAYLTPQPPRTQAKVTFQTPRSISFTDLPPAAMVQEDELRATRGGKSARFTTEPSQRGGRPMSSSPAISTPPALNRMPTSRALIQDSADDSSDGQRILQQMGIVELLEQDELPTFIIEPGSRLNALPGGLRILFANSAFSNFTGLLEAISGSKMDSSSVFPSAFTEFKAWSLSFVKDKELIAVSLPSIPYAGMIWTASSIRKRFRVIKGKPQAPIRHPVVSPAHGARRSREASTESSHFSRFSGSEHHYFRPTMTTGASSSSHDSHNIQEYPSTANDPEILDDETAVVDPSPAEEKEVQYHMQPTYDETEGHFAGTPRRSLSPSDLSSHEALLRASSAGQVDTFMRPNIALGKGFFDWTRLPLSSSLPRHVRFARNVNWDQTSLGPIGEWHPQLRSMCNLIMASPNPCAMYWGPDLIAIYNESYIQLAAQKHPVLMGQSYRDAWKEIWSEVEPEFDAAMNHAQATMRDDQLLFMQRSGFLEETYFTYSVIPIIGDDGAVVGIYNPAFEKTRRNIAERRMLTLRSIGEKTAPTRDIKSFWARLLEGFDYNGYDVPFVLLYSTVEEESDGSSVHSSSWAASKQCCLEGSIGVPEGHISAPKNIDLKSGSDGFAFAFRDVLNANGPIHLRVDDGSLPTHLLQGMEFRGFGDPCQSAVVCPIQPTTSENTLGFLVMGMNPRRPYDEDYVLFIDLLSRQIATSIASVLLFEEEIRRGQRAAELAAQDRMELSNQLAARTRQAFESEKKFTRMAEFAPVGMFIADSRGEIIYCNDTWYDITGVDRGDTFNWQSYIADEDQTAFKIHWDNLIQRRQLLSAEFRFKKSWKDRDGIVSETWVLGSAYPERGSQGELLSVFGSLTDISQQKWAENVQIRRREEAVELKRQQENFIDTTSHEMRNPLTAILQSSEEIASSLAQLRLDPNIPPPFIENIESNIDSAQTIMLCAQHQKRIVDDVLTLSKLDSALLLVTPTDCQPIQVVQKALKIFESEVNANGIDLKFVVDQSFPKLGLNWVRLDPSRLLQVLINLVTNAIKFTATQETRQVTICLAASTEIPSSRPNRSMSYVPRVVNRPNLTVESEWGSGARIFLEFTVKDTGRGLKDDEMKLLFQRFSQASPRTHVTYGGSGLGLFISRQLVELQGGEIGVASKSGVGSTFAFWVEARKSTAPEKLEEFDTASTTLPARRSPDPAAKAARRLIPKAASSMPLPPDQVLSVLIVEDNIVNQKVLAKQLRKRGHNVYVANHGLEGIQKLKRSYYWITNQDTGSPAPPTPMDISPAPTPPLADTSMGPPSIPASASRTANLAASIEEPASDDLPINIDIVLMDLEMPIMDGMTATRRIRELQKTGHIIRHVPIIAVTANARQEQIDDTMRAGVVSYSRQKLPALLS